MRLRRTPTTELGAEDLQVIVRSALRTDMASFRALHDGAFGVLYDVRLEAYPGRVVVKAQKFADRAAIEARQLAELRRHAPVRVPEVYACVSAKPGLPEALVLEYLPGVEGRRLGDLDSRARAAVAGSIIDTLLALHAYQHSGGYGELDGPWYAHWVEYYRPWVEAVFKELRRRVGTADAPQPGVLETGELALAHIEAVFSGRAAPAVLVHGDFCLGNLMFNPNSHQVIGLIDPLDCVWGDAERDLVHLAKSNGERYGLLTEYQRRVPPDDGFTLRYWFHMFWTWLSYDASIGLREDGWYLKCAERLREELARAGL